MKVRMNKGYCLLTEEERAIIKKRISESKGGNCIEDKSEYRKAVCALWRSQKISLKGRKIMEGIKRR